jgi:hypothetical protein
MSRTWKTLFVAVVVTAVVVTAVAPLVATAGEPSKEERLAKAIEALNQRLAALEAKVDGKVTRVETRSSPAPLITPPDATSPPQSKTTCIRVVNNRCFEKVTFVVNNVPQQPEVPAKQMRDFEVPVGTQVTYWVVVHGWDSYPIVYTTTVLDPKHTVILTVQ